MQTTAIAIDDRLRYLIESKPVAWGGFAWRVMHERQGGKKTLLANGVMFPGAGEGLDHEALVSFVESMKDRQLTA